MTHDLRFASYAYARATSHPASLISAFGADAEEFERRYREVFMRGDCYPVDTESEPFSLPEYLRKDGREEPGNLMWPTPSQRARRQVQQAIRDALDGLEKHPDFKAGSATMNRSYAARYPAPGRKA